VRAVNSFRIDTAMATWITARVNSPATRRKSTAKPITNTIKITSIELRENPAWRRETSSPLT